MTLLLISHKLSLVHMADQIVLIDEGKAPESGSHQELLRLNGKYKRIWTVQNS